MFSAALYLGQTVFRIHGTNDPTSIGKHVSSGCIRLQNADIIDLYNRVGIGTKVVVLASDARRVSLDDRNPVVTQDPPAGGRMSQPLARVGARAMEVADHALVIGHELHDLHPKIREGAGRNSVPNIG